MSDVFAPPSSDVGGEAVVDAHVYVVAALEIAISIGPILLGLIAPIVLGFDTDDPDFAGMSTAMRVAAGCVESVFLLGFGGVFAFGGFGLLLRWRWGWVAAIVALGLGMFGCCAPVCIYGFWALLRAPVRKAYGFG
jgi:hypothetical protein